MRVRSDFVHMPNPYAAGPDDPDATVVLVPAVTADVALLHGFAADRQGTAELDGRTDDRLAAQAADYVIVTVERVVDALVTPTQRNGTLLGGWQVHAIVEVPHGSHPTACAEHTPLDAEHIREYLAAAADPDAWQAYWDRYVRIPDDPAAYWDLVSGAVAA